MVIKPAPVFVSAPAAPPWFPDWLASTAVINKSVFAFPVASATSNIVFEPRWRPLFAPEPEMVEAAAPPTVTPPDNPQAWKEALKPPTEFNVPALSVTGPRSTQQRLEAKTGSGRRRWQFLHNQALLTERVQLRIINLPHDVGVRFCFDRHTTNRLVFFTFMHEVRDDASDSHN